jgi:hypothetical protein
MLLVDILKDTPLWISFLFAYLLYIGIRALKPRTIQLKKMTLLPILFLAWSLYILVVIFNGSYFLAWVVSLIAGTVFGWSFVRKTPLHIDKAKHLVTVPGSWSTLILIFAIFIIRCFFVYTYVTHPDEAKNFLFAFLDIISSGAITGIFFGRILFFWHKFSTHKE